MHNSASFEILDSRGEEDEVEHWVPQYGNDFIAERRTSQQLNL